MEREQRFFRFQIFSSAEAILAFGLDDLVRLGVNFVWMGVETKSREANFTKNAGVDPQRLVRELRDRGITVLASGILCMEHHTPENIQEDIDHLVDLEADFTQFMLLTPLPTTALYQEKKASGLLREDLPYEEWHGQKMLNYRHPHFPGDAAERWIRQAFRQEYEENSSSIYRVTETALRGYRHLAGLERRDACLEARLAQARERVEEYALILPEIGRHAVNELERERVADLAPADGRGAGQARAARAGLPAGDPGPRGAVALAGLAVRGRHPADDASVTRYPAARRGAAASAQPVDCPLPEVQRSPASCRRRPRSGSGRPSGLRRGARTAAAAAGPLTSPGPRPENHGPRWNRITGWRSSAPPASRRATGSTGTSTRSPGAWPRSASTSSPAAGPA